VDRSTIQVYNQHQDQFNLAFHPSRVGKLGKQRTGLSG